MATLSQAPDAGRPLPEAGAHTFRFTIVIIALFAALALALVPIADRPGPEMPGVSAVFAASIFVTELATGFLILVRFREVPTWSLLLLGAAYLFSALMAVPYLLTFPGAMLPGRSIVGGTQSTAWIFIAWITGYALLTLMAVAVEAGLDKQRIARRQVGRAIAVAVAGVLIVVAALFVAATVMVDRLPPLLGGARWTGLDTAISYVAVAMLAGGVAIILLRIRRNELFLWLSLALTAMALANIVSTAGGGRYTVGWTACRLSWMASACALFLYFMGQFVRQQRLLGRARDALEQRVTERTADLTGMVSQRDLLLREVHHRVKNNFQVVNSLINFQASHSHSDETRDALHSLHRRVFALGLVHQQLMQSSTLATFDIRAFLDDLCANLATWADADKRGIRIAATADALQTDLDFAGPLGLLLTDLVSNAFARFAPGQTGAISVSLRMRGADALVLRVADNGNSERNPTALDSAATEPRITMALIKQLQGELDTAHDNGTVATIIMPPPRGHIGRV